MMGQNEVVKQNLNATALRVKEVFYTIQGEGPLAGHPAVFVRMGGCNLRCNFCDTDFEGGEERAYESLALQVEAEFTQNESRRIAPKLVVLTGGEPLLQPLAPLIARWNDVGIAVQVETAGTVWDDRLAEYFQERGEAPRYRKNTLVVSPKTPEIHAEVAFRADAWKYLIRDGHVDEEGFPTHSTQPGQPGPIRYPRPWDYTRRTGFTPISKGQAFWPNVGCIFLQPVDDGADLLNIANSEEAVRACMRHGYRISLQQHKILELP